MTRNMTPTEWLLSGDTGVSSQTIFAVMTRSKISRTDVPYDPSDFGQCYRLLALFPEWRPRLREVSALFPEWGPLVDAWDELTGLYEEGLQNPLRRAPKLYERMRALIDEGRIAAGWERAGAGS